MLLCAGNSNSKFMANLPTTSACMQYKRELGTNKGKNDWLIKCFHLRSRGVVIENQSSVGHYGLFAYSWRLKTKK